MRVGDRNSRAELEVQDFRQVRKPTPSQEASKRKEILLKPATYTDLLANRRHEVGLQG